MNKTIENWITIKSIFEWDHEKGKIVAIWAGEKINGKWKFIKNVEIHW